MKLLLLVALFGIAAGAASAAHEEPAEGEAQEEGPITKVVDLIQELKAKIEADGANEQKVFDKYACWCEETTARKASAISEAMATIKSLGTTILGLKGKAATRAS